MPRISAPGKRSWNGKLEKLADEIPADHFPIKSMTAIYYNGDIIIGYQMLNIGVGADAGKELQCVKGTTDLAPTSFRLEWINAHGQLRMMSDRKEINDTGAPVSGC
jgi:hypothetical protein